MKTEWYGAAAEHTLPAEFAGRGEEFAAPEKKEFLADRAEEEYFKAPPEWGAPTAPKPAPKKKRRKKSGKMGYLVTACLATVVAAQAALGVPSLMLETDRPVLFAKGGVVTCLRNQGQMMDYKGNPIEIESARGQRLEYLFGGMPNKDGYSLYGPYLVDKNGAVLCRWEQAEEINYATVTDDNIIFTVENKFSTGRENIVYRRPDGSVLYQTGPAEILNSKNAVIGSTPFYNGQALVCNGSQLMTLNTKGETTVLAQWTATPRDVDRQGLLLGSDGQYNIQNIPHRVMDTMADGWYLAINMWTQPLLANAETGQVLMIPQQAEEGWTVLHQRGGFAPTYGFSTRQFESYWDKGALLAHHGTYVCIAVKGETEKDMLVDVKQLQGAQTLGSYIALYDNIYFDNSQYLLCREGQEYFYIDFDGNLVSGPYACATTFSDSGYAVAMEKSGRAFLLNHELERVKTLPGVTGADPEARGEAFLLYKGDTQYLYLVP